MVRLRRALQVLEHRGPDDHDCLTFPAAPDRGPIAALGNRRLSILDLSPAGRQPMTTRDGRYSITYNGEIYNYREIREELEAAGCRFGSQCDTEVLLQAFAVWGAASLGRLEGMFAFAILDRLGRRLTLARDPFGIKPLFFSRRHDRLVFASEIRAVRVLEDARMRVNPSRVLDYLASAHTGDGAETVFADVQQVPPGHYLDVSLDLASSELTRYWRHDPGERRALSLPAAADELRSIFLDAVRLHLRSDVPVGLSLSGGTDSSSGLLAARHVLGPSAEICAFGFAADEPAISETVYQERAAAAAGATLHSVTVNAQDVARDFGQTIDIQGEPFSSPTIYAQYRVFARAREEGVRVILGGQGADELFAGYQTHAPARAATLLKQGRWVAAARLIGASAARWGIDRRMVGRRAISLALPEHLALGIRRVMRREGGLDWIDHHWFERAGVAVTPQWRPRGREVLRELLLHTIENAHLQALMRYEDRSAMALSLENRVPFLTPRIARYVFSLPEQYLVSSDGEHKTVLRQAMRGIVPDVILDRRDKIGFAVPFARWLVELRPWVEERLSMAATCPAIKHTAVREHWAAVQRRGSIGSAFVIWRCIGLVTWAERAEVTWQ